MESISNFTFFKETDLYGASALYQKIYQSACRAEQTYYVNIDISRLYTRRTVEYLCAFLEQTRILKLSDNGSHTIADYAAAENQEIVLPAIGGSDNYLALRSLYQATLPGVCQPDTVTMLDMILNLYRLLFWFYKRCGGTATRTIHDFSVYNIPEEVYPENLLFLFTEDTAAPMITPEERYYISALKTTENLVSVAVENGQKQIIYSADGHIETWTAISNTPITPELRQDLLSRFLGHAKNFRALLSLAEQWYQQQEKRWFTSCQKARKELKHIRRKCKAEVEKKRTIDALIQNLKEESPLHKRQNKTCTLYFRQVQKHLDSLIQELRNFNGDDPALIRLCLRYEEAKTEYEALRLYLDIACFSVPTFDAIRKTMQYFFDQRLSACIQDLKDYYAFRKIRYSEEKEHMRKQREACYVRPYSAFIEYDSSIHLSRELAKESRNSMGNPPKYSLTSFGSVAIFLLFGVLLLALWRQSPLLLRQQSKKPVDNTVNNNIVEHTENIANDNTDEYTENTTASPLYRSTPKIVDHHGNITLVPHISEGLLKDLRWMEEYFGEFMEIIRRGTSNEEYQLIETYWIMDTPRKIYDIAALSTEIFAYDASEIHRESDDGNSEQFGIAVPPSIFSSDLSYDTSLSDLLELLGSVEEHMDVYIEPPTEFSQPQPAGNTYNLVFMDFYKIDTADYRVCFIFDQDCTRLVDYVYILGTVHQNQDNSYENNPDVQ